MISFLTFSVIFFTKKVVDLRAELDNSLSTSHTDASPIHPVDSVFGSFRLVTEQDVKKVIFKSRPTSCLLDPIPTPLLVECLDPLLPTITHIVNDSLMSGSFPLSFKSAVVKPLLKKPSFRCE